MNLYIFDCFGVLCNEIAVTFFNTHFPNKEEAAKIKDQYFVPTDLGLYTLDETLQKIAKDYNLDVNEVRAEFKSNAIVRQEMLDFVASLRKDNNTALLSNAARGVFEDYIHIDFPTYFDKTFISYDYKMQKPDLAFYKECLKGFANQYDHIYFIDDNIKNVSVVKELGIEGILFTNLKDLKERLGK